LQVNIASNGRVHRELFERVNLNSFLSFYLFYLKSKVFRLKKEGSPDMAKFFLQQKKAGVRNDYGNKAVSEI
jgi:hypothetical protein